MGRPVAKPKLAGDLLQRLIETKKAQVAKLEAEIRELEAYLERMDA